MIPHATCARSLVAVSAKTRRMQTFKAFYAVRIYPAVLPHALTVCKYNRQSVVSGSL